MDHLLEHLSQHLSEQLIALRRKRGLTQARLAKLAKIPRSTLSHLESGAGNPSLSNLTRVSAALQIRVEELLSPPRARCRLIKADQIPTHARGHSAKIFKLLPDPLPGMEIDSMEIEPGGRLAGIPHSTGTKEYLTCIQGQISVSILGERFTLSKGDVLAFPGDQPHGYQNPGAVKAICLSVVALTPTGI